MASFWKEYRCNSLHLCSIVAHQSILLLFFVFYSLHISYNLVRLHSIVPVLFFPCYKPDWNAHRLFPQSPLICFHLPITRSNSWFLEPFFNSPEVRVIGSKLRLLKGLYLFPLPRKKMSELPFAQQVPWKNLLASRHETQITTHYVHQLGGWVWSQAIIYTCSGRGGWEGWFAEPGTYQYFF